MTDVEYYRAKEKEHRALGSFDYAVAYQQMADYLEAHPDNQIPHCVFCTNWNPAHPDNRIGPYA